jgi:arabinofuranosyltransferase
LIPPYNPAVPRISFRIALALWGAIAIAVVALYGGSAMDDFFITYRYADNLGEGRGFVFNPGERVFGLTEPAYGATLGLLHFVTRIPAPWMGSLTTALGLIGLGWILVAESRTRGQELEAWIGGTLAITLTFIWGCRGAGVIPGLALLAAAVALRERPAVAGFLGALAAGFRPELALGLFFAWMLIAKEARTRGWRFGASAAATGLAGGLVLWLWFGRLSPITLGAKRDFAAWDPVARSSGRHFWPGFVPLFERHWGATWPLFLALGIAGCVLALRRGGAAMKTIVTLGLALALVYPLLGVPLFGWYTIPSIVAALYGFGYVAVALVRLAARAPRAGAAVAAVAALLLALLTLPVMKSLAWGLTHPAVSGHYRSYRDAGLWIREHSGPGARVTALEVGTLAYFSDRPVIDLLGLVSPTSLENVARREVIESLRADPTDFFVLTSGLEGMTGPVRVQPWFEATYELAHELPAVDNGAMWIFRRRS